MMTKSDTINSTTSRYVTGPHSTWSSAVPALAVTSIDCLNASPTSGDDRSNYTHRRSSHVRLNDQVETKVVPGLSDYTESEKRACWYQSSDLRTIQKESRTTIDQYRLQQRQEQQEEEDQSEMTGSGRCCSTDMSVMESLFHRDLMNNPTRGLEYQIDKERRTSQVRAAIRSVLCEQHVAAKKTRRHSTTTIIDRTTGGDRQEQQQQQR